MTLDPKSLISIDRICDLKSEKKEDVLDELIGLLSTSKNITDKDELRQKIIEREKAVSTGVGAGMAIPHVKIASIKDFTAAIGRSREGVDFESLDGKPTHIVIMIGCNNTQSADFLKILAKLVTKLKNEETQQKILEANSPEEIRDLFVSSSGILTG